MTLARSESTGTVRQRCEEPEPTWDIAYLFPAQGMWSVEEYLALQGNRLVEYSNGIVEVLAVPTMVHQLVLAYLHAALLAYVRPRSLGTVLFAPFRVRLWEDKFRQPDVMFMLSEHAARMSNEFWDGADLVMEVVSDDDRRRDVDTKRFEYARAGIPEYWIVEPQHSRVTVLRLDGHRYVVDGEFAPGQQALSSLLPGFGVDVAALFAAGQQQ